MPHRRPGVTRLTPRQARIVTEGIPDVPGTTMMEKRAHLMENMDPIQQILLREPRG